MFVDVYEHVVLYVVINVTVFGDEDGLVWQIVSNLDVIFKDALQSF